MDTMFINRGETWDPIVYVLNVDGTTPAAPDDVIFRVVDKPAGTLQWQLSSGSGITVGARVSGQPIYLQFSRTPTQTSGLTEGSYLGALWFRYGTEVRTVDARVPVRVQNSAIV